MIKRIIKRYEQWKRNVGIASPFVIICGVIALLYFGYRIMLIAVPSFALEQSFNPHSQKNDVVCHEQDDSIAPQPPLLSNSYQTRIRNQKSLTSNLVLNADLTQVSRVTGGPVGYSHTVDSKNVDYQYLRQATDGTLYLRTVNAEKRPDDQVQPAWQINPVVIPAQTHTYAYSFWYRSTVPVHVSTEHASAGKQATYSDVMTLDASSDWQQFTAHYNNSDNATSFRMDINGEGAGQVDIRGFDIHQIPDAELAKGLVTVTFDDGWQSIADHALPLLNAYDIKTTQYIISEVADHDTPGYMNIGTIADMKKAGHEIGSHSLNHCNQTELPKNSIETNALKSKQQLEDRKLGPILTFAYPLGQYNKLTQSIYDKTYPLIRSSDFGYNDRYFDATNVHSMAVLSDTSDTDFKSWLDYAKTHKVWLVLVYHRVDENGKYDITNDQFERQLKMIKGSGLPILPMTAAAKEARK